MRVSEKLSHECEKCVYVASRDGIVVPIDVAKKVKKSGKRPIFINYFTMPNWVGHAAFYMFKCSYCGHLVIDYPHGYVSPGYLFLTCQACDIGFILKGYKYKEIYERENLELPKSFFASILGLVKRRLIRACLGVKE